MTNARHSRHSKRLAIVGLPVFLVESSKDRDLFWFVFPNLIFFLHKHEVLFPNISMN